MSNQWSSGQLVMNGRHVRVATRATKAKGDSSTESGARPQAAQLLRNNLKNCQGDPLGRMTMVVETGFSISRQTSSRY